MPQHHPSFPYVFQDFLYDFSKQSCWNIIIGGEKHPVPLGYQVEKCEGVYYDPVKKVYHSVKHESEELEASRIAGLPSTEIPQLGRDIKAQRIKSQIAIQEQLAVLGYLSPRTHFLTDARTQLKWVHNDQNELDHVVVNYALLRTSEEVDGVTLHDLLTESSMDLATRLAMAEKGGREGVVVGALLDDNDRGALNILYSQGDFYHIDFEFAGRSDEEECATALNIKDYLSIGIPLNFALLADDFKQVAESITANDKIAPQQKKIYHDRIANALDIVQFYQNDKGSHSNNITPYGIFI